MSLHDLTPSPTQLHSWRQLAYVSDDLLMALIRQSPATAARLSPLLREHQRQAEQPLLAAVNNGN